MPADYSSVQGILAPPGLSAEQLEWWTTSLRGLADSEEVAARALLTDLGLLRG